MERRDCDVLIVGGGPSGMRAAEVANAAGARVILCDAQSSAGRKFLVAGRGGLNLTHSEPVENFPARYGDEEGRWQVLLAEFGPDALRAWAEQLEVETYVGTSGRVFPRGQKAAILLRAWLKRLQKRGVEMQLNSRLVRLRDGQAEFQCGDALLEISARAVVLALGGASWPETGSDGMWPALLAEKGIEITPWVPANCGWEVDWPADLLARAEGLPLKNLSARAGGETVNGELLITRYGLEGGAIYRLGPVLRALQPAVLHLDLKPQLSAEALLERLANGHGPWSKILKLNPGATSLLEVLFPNETSDPAQLVARVKDLPIKLRAPRPIAEAISSAGGVRWSELDASLMLRKMPGVFVAGEMIDWEAPTGGYLLQGCFSTGTRAGREAARFSQAGKATDAA